MERWIQPLPLRWAVVLGCGLLALSLGLASYRVWAEEKKTAEALLQQGEQKAAAAKSTTQIKREDLRYGGKDFYQWRRDLLTELKGSIRVDGVRAFAAFGANGYGPEATQAILEIMRGYDVTQMNMTNQSEDDTAVLRAGIQAVGKIGVAALPALTQAVEGKNRNIRLFAIEALHVLRDDARSAVPVLLKAVKNDDVTTRQHALNAVGVIDVHAKGFVPALIEALKDKDAGIRFLALTRLRENGIVEAAKPAIPALLEVLQDKDSGMRLNAIQTLNSIGADKHGVLVVCKLLDDKNWEVSRGAYSFLQSLGPDAKEAVPALIKVLKNGKEGVLTFYTLEAIGPAAKDAIPELTKFLRSDNQKLRERAMQALKKISPDDKR